MPPLRVKTRHPQRVKLVGVRVVLPPARMEERFAGSSKLDRAKRLAEKHGARGLGVVGPLVLGPTITVVVGLGLGIEKRELAWWLSIGTAVTFAPTRL